MTLHGVIKQLQNMDVKGNMIQFISLFLLDKLIKIRVRNIFLLLNWRMVFHRALCSVLPALLLP